MVNSNAKGKTNERAAAKLLTSMGFEARRGVQYQGGAESPDVHCPMLDRVHIEVKSTAAMRDDGVLMDAAYEQARQDAGEHKEPVVLWKTKGRKWRLTYVDAFGVRVTTTGDARIKRVLSVMQGLKSVTDNGATP